MPISCTGIGNFPEDSMSSNKIIMQFLYTKIGNFPDDFMSFNELCNFYTKIGKFPDGLCFSTSYTIIIGKLLTFSRYPIKKQIETIDAAQSTLSTVSFLFVHNIPTLCYLLLHAHSFSFIDTGPPSLNCYFVST